MIFHLSLQRQCHKNSSFRHYFLTFAHHDYNVFSTLSSVITTYQLCKHIECVFSHASLSTNGRSHCCFFMSRGIHRSQIYSHVVKLHVKTFCIASILLNTIHIANCQSNLKQQKQHRRNNDSPFSPKCHYDFNHCQE